MPDDNRSDPMPKVGDHGNVRLGGQWQPAKIISRTERGKSETVMAQTDDGTVVVIGAAAQWKR